MLDSALSLDFRAPTAVVQQRGLVEEVQLLARTKLVKVHWTIHLNFKVLIPEDIPTIFLRGCGWSVDPKMQGAVAL